MSVQLRNILIFGSTGLIGSHICDAVLAAKENFGKIALFASPGSIARKAKIFDDYRARGATIIEGELQNQEDVLRAYEGYDTVISALGREALALQIDLIRLAEQSDSIKLFLPSEFGTDIEYSEASTHEPVHQQKLAVRRHFRDHVERLEHTFLVTGPYPDYYFGMGTPPNMPPIGAFDAKTKTASVSEPADQKISWTTMPDVGRFVVAALLRPDVSRNRALKVQSFIASHQDVLAEFEKQTGVKWGVKHTTLDQLRQWETNDGPNSAFLKSTTSLRRLWMNGETLYPEWDNEALSVTQTDTLEKVVKAAVQLAG